MLKNPLVQAKCSTVRRKDKIRKEHNLIFFRQAPSIQIFILQCQKVHFLCIQIKYFTSPQIVQVDSESPKYSNIVYTTSNQGKYFILQQIS